jgi:type IV secretory pathway TraG/TraD family ATPase VirD4
MASDGQTWAQVLEGDIVQAPSPVVGAEFSPDRPVRAVVQGVDSAIRFDDDLLSKHVLFLGAIGSGKTNAMYQLFSSLRDNATEGDVFVVFDTKGDFREQFRRDGDCVVSNEREAGDGRVIWNIFEDLHASGPERIDECFEIASTIFSKDISRAGDNLFFAAGARDVFAAVLEIMARGGGHPSNRDLRQQLEASQEDLSQLAEGHSDVAGARRYLTGKGNTPMSILTFLQQAVQASFSGVFREPGDFSVRRFVHEKGGRALFIEYDIAAGGVLLPIYRVLLDLAMKEALGRSRSPGNVFFLMDEFALLPELTHLTDGINFGRSLGVKFICGSQNVAQVQHAYGPEMASSILSGFGTVFAFRLMDADSRDFISQRFGRNRKQLTVANAVRSKGVDQQLLDGNVIEDWDLSSLTVGRTIASLPDGPPFFFDFKEWS